jgi:hypothetical protein
MTRNCRYKSESHWRAIASRAQSNNLQSQTRCNRARVNGLVCSCQHCKNLGDRLQTGGGNNIFKFILFICACFFFNKLYSSDSLMYQDTIKSDSLIIQFIGNNSENIKDLQKLEIFEDNTNKFVLLDSIIVHLNPHSLPKYKNDICKTLINSCQDIDSIYVHADPIIVITFIVDSNGKIIKCGFINKSNIDDYDNRIESVMLNIIKNDSFIPAYNNNQPVTALYSVFIRFGSKTCRIINY